MKHEQDIRGFTLVELLIVVALTGIITAAVYQTFYAGQRSHEVQKNLVEMQQNARVAISVLSTDFRQVSYGKDPTQPSIQFAGPDSIVFAADMDPDTPGAEEISYFLSPDGDPDTENPDDTILMKQVCDSGGVVIYEEPQSYGITADGLTFRYFNGQGTELENPVPQPEVIGEMMIEVTATERAQWKEQPYATTTLSATVYPRNLPFSPARSRPSQPACDSPTYPNCSSVTLSWDTPTTNTDGTPLEFSDISHFNIWFGTDADDLDLEARLARTFNEWTVDNLGCDDYYVAVTCVSRSGVESHPCLRAVSASSGQAPSAPVSMFTYDSAGVVLDWTPVNTYDDGTTLDVPVRYNVHRSTASGFTPDDSTRIAIVTGGNSRYHDTPSDDCATYYYVVSAQACCSEGDPSPEDSADRPSPPQCPSSLVASPGLSPATIDVQWTHPSLREDLSTLDVADIAGTYVYYDTLPGGTSQYAVVSGNGTTTTIVGLTGCSTYYLHARTLDACGHLSETDCLGNEVVFNLPEPCNPSPPAPPATINVAGMDMRIDMTWEPNSQDCDLAGYKIYYGTAHGVYNGVGALEGPSPVTVTKEEATQGDMCSASLTGIDGCTTLYVTITCYDSCDPPHESGYSPEGVAYTSCTPCGVQASCPAWVSTPSAGHRDAHLEVFTLEGHDETIAKIVPVWNTAAKVMAVYYGRPLALIWNQDGSAGEDTEPGPRDSGATLNIDDVVVPSWSGPEDGVPLALVFDSDARDMTLDFTFKSPTGGYCTAGGTNRAGAIFDDFDDGNLVGWTVVSGTWTTPAGELYQSSTSLTRILVGNDSFTDCTWEGKIKITSGTTAFLIFRYGDANNFYSAYIKSDSDVVRLARMRSGTLTTVQTHSTPISNNTWYNLKIVVQGSRARVWFDCAAVLDYTDALMRASGKVGFRTSSTAAKWDDVRCQSAAVLP